MHTIDKQKLGRILAGIGACMLTLTAFAVAYESRLKDAHTRGTEEAITSLIRERTELERQQQSGKVSDTFIQGEGGLIDEQIASHEKDL